MSDSFDSVRVNFPAKLRHKCIFVTHQIYDRLKLTRELNSTDKSIFTFTRLLITIKIGRGPRPSRITDSGAASSASPQLPRDVINSLAMSCDAALNLLLPGSVSGLSQISKFEIHTEHDWYPC